MNALLWMLQVLLALHTAMGAIWKLSNSEQAVPSLSAIPHGVWLAMSAVELLCSAGLLVPTSKKSLRALAPVAAVVIAAEMLLFSAVHLYSGDPNYGPLIYWLIVAVVCTFIAYGRFVARPF